MTVYTYVSHAFFKRWQGFQLDAQTIRSSDEKYGHLQSLKPPGCTIVFVVLSVHPCILYLSPSATA